MSDRGFMVGLFLIFGMAAFSLFALLGGLWLCAVALVKFVFGG